MMKFWMLAPVLLCFFSLQTMATELEKMQAETQILLTYEQFASLTHVEQKTYVKKLREIVVEMSTAFPEVAIEMSARSSFFTQLWNLNFQTAYGEEDGKHSLETIEAYVASASIQAESYLKIVSQTKTNDLSKEKKALLVEQYRQSLYWSASAAAQAYQITDKTRREQILKNSVNPTKKKLEDAEERVKQFAKEEEYSVARDQYFKKAHRGELLPDENFPSELTPYGERLLPQASETTDKKGIVSTTAATGTAKVNTSNDSYYRCMYAGFVIKKGPECKAPRTLPWDLDGLDSKKFACEKGAIMCNPFIFGFKTDCDWDKSRKVNKTENCLTMAKPYCVNSGLYATKNCAAKSNNDSALQAAVELINRNVTVFNQFGESFGDLCNKGLIEFNSYKRKRTQANIQKTKNDIKRTCESARTRMAEIEKRYNIKKNGQQKKELPLPQPESPAENKGAQ